MRFDGTRFSPGEPSGSQVMTNIFKRFASDESGATAIEYGLIASLIAVAIIAALNVLATKLSGTFTLVGNSLKQS
jgi:pilus assembly protein Flp/PilA